MCRGSARVRCRRRRVAVRRAAGRSAGRAARSRAAGRCRRRADAHSRPGWKEEWSRTLGTGCRCRRNRRRRSWSLRSEPAAAHQRARRRAATGDREDRRRPAAGGALSRCRRSHGGDSRHPCGARSAPHRARRSESGAGSVRPRVLEPGSRSRRRVRQSAGDVTRSRLSAVGDSAWRRRGANQRGAPGVAA